jgi:hypothetical protein
MRPRRVATRGGVVLVVGEAEGQVVGVAGVAPAELLGEAGEPAVEPQAEGVGQGWAGWGALGQAARAEGDVVGLALGLDDFAGGLGADQ